MVSSSIRLTAWLQNSKKRAERSERLMYEQSHRDYLRSGYLHHRLLSWAVNHNADNAITYKAQRQKCQRTEAGERGNYWHADASAWCCCARCKIHEGVRLMLKLKMMLCVMKCCRWSSSVAHQQSVSQCVKANTASGVDNAASPDWQTPLNGIISPSERLITMQKQLEGTQKY